MSHSTQTSNSPTPNPHTSGPNSHGDSVFVFTERLTPIAGKEAEVLQICQQSAGLLRTQPGIIQTFVTRSQQRDGQIMTVSMWDKQTSFQAFLKSDAMAELMASESFGNIKEWMTDYDGQMSDLIEGWHP